MTEIIPVRTDPSAFRGENCQVNTAVSQLDQMTQQNAALVEESSAASESLKDQAARLTQLVSVFRLDAAAQTLPR